jgi:ParB family chromosome partitioning protein
MSSQFFGDSIFWIEVEKIKPNPYQPRRDFDEARLKDLSESIRMYGVLQPLVVTRKEFTKEDGGLGVEYELIAGERRLRASKLAGLQQVPALIRNGEESDKMKLELAIIENLQREDINSVDRARAFDRLAKEFGMKHIQIAEKVGKSREYVSNTMRILSLPEEILNGLSEGKLSEGHTRPLLMLVDKPEEQLTLFKEIVFKKLTVREAEAYARKIAQDKVRKKSLIDPELIEMENKLKESLGTRVSIEKRENSGRITIDYFTADDIRNFLEKISINGVVPVENLEKKIIANAQKSIDDISNATPLQVSEVNAQDIPVEEIVPETADLPVDDRAPAEIVEEENTEDLYSVKNFGV